MFDVELKKYKLLNELAECGGIVILGGTEDVEIPLGELKQAFSMEENIYNRSIKGISVVNLKSVYDACVAPLVPETILLHIGEEDVKLFQEDAAAFIGRYSAFITYIKSQNKNCRVVVVSLRNYENDETIGALNQQLKYMADSQQCEYGDIANKRVWNPKSTMEAISFVYAIGFVRPLKRKRPLHDLVKLFFYC